MPDVHRLFFLAKHITLEQRCTPVVEEDGFILFYESMDRAWRVGKEKGLSADVYVREVFMLEPSTRVSISEFIKLAQVPFPYDIDPLSMMDSFVAAYSVQANRLLDKRRMRIKK